MITKDPASRIARLIKNVEPALQAAFLRSVHTLENRLSVEEIVELLEAGNIAYLLSLMTPSSEAMADEVTSAYTDTGSSTAAWLRNSVLIAAAFNPLVSRPHAFMMEERNRVVSSLLDRQQESARAALVEGIRKGMEPKQQAVLFKESIGLTRNQHAAVINYRHLLETGSREALRRSLRDHRFDLTVDRAIKNEQPLTADAIARMTKRYRERMLKHRAATIARSEATRAANHAVDEAYNQAVDAGVLDRNNIEKRWVTSMNERRRPSHIYMHGQLRRQGEAFLTGSGNMIMHPGDSNAPASEVVNCVCMVTRSIKHG